MTNKEQANTKYLWTAKYLYLYWS